MRNRAFRPIAAILSILLFAGTRVYAGPVAITEVLQVLGSYQNGSELQLRTVSQLGSNRSTRSASSARTGGTLIFGGAAGADVATADSLLAGIATSTEEASDDVDVVAAGDFEGTICDCGEIMVPSGGLPKWPLIFLAAVPLLFIPNCEECDSTPTPTPTPPGEMPEPTSLLLLGSGLAAFGAGLRRRYARSKITAGNTEEG